jgi:hypothetical protein
MESVRHDGKKQKAVSELIVRQFNCCELLNLQRQASDTLPSHTMFSKKKVYSSGAKTFKHNVSFYWGEKAWLFIDYLQIYGVLW